MPSFSDPGQEHMEGWPLTGPIEAQAPPAILGSLVVVDDDTPDEPFNFEPGDYWSLTLEERRLLTDELRAHTGTATLPQSLRKKLVARLKATRALAKPTVDVPPPGYQVWNPHNPNPPD